MDSRTGFAILLILSGLGAAYLAVTGKAQAFLAALKGAPAAPALQSDPGQIGAGGGGGGPWGSSTPSGTASAGTPTPSVSAPAAGTQPAGEASYSTLPEILSAISYAQAAGLPTTPAATPYAGGMPAGYAPTSPFQIAVVPTSPEQVLPAIPPGSILA